MARDVYIVDARFTMQLSRDKALREFEQSHARDAVRERVDHGIEVSGRASSPSSGVPVILASTLNLYI